MQRLSRWNAFTIAFLVAILWCAVQAQYQEDFDFGSCSHDKSKYDWEQLNLYQLLGFSNESTTKLDSKAIRKAYRLQAQQWHPDKLKANETLSIDEINSRFGAIATAHETLSDPETREAYDRYLKNCDYMRGKSSAYSSRNRSQQSYDPSDNPYSHPQHQQHTRTPSSVQKEREMLIDPMTGIPILRETTYEEFHEESFYRISIQDYDSYHRPLYPYPQIVEEGPIHHPSRHNHHHYENLQTTDTLHAGSVLRAGEALFSSNNHYRAHVSNCHLVVETKDPDDDIKIIWQSLNEVPDMMGGWGMEQECFLALEGSQLLIAGGSPELHNGQILWFTNADRDDEEETYGYAPGYIYKARLENDGKLVVYRVSALDETEETCVYATGFLGCFRLVGKIVSASKVAKDRVTILLNSLVATAKEHNKDEYFGDDNEETLSGQYLMQVGLRWLSKLNRTRRRIEIHLEERSLRMVYEVEWWWQEQFQRF